MPDNYQEYCANLISLGRIPLPLDVFEEMEGLWEEEEGGDAANSPWSPWLFPVTIITLVIVALVVAL
jgi:hypothetical protein